MEVYFLGETATLHRLRYHAGGWLPEEDLGVPVSGEIAAASFGPGHVEVFQVAFSGALQRVYAEAERPGDAPAGPVSAPGILGPGLGVTAQAGTRIDCVVRRAGDDTVMHNRYDDGYWGGWTLLGGPAGADPALALAGNGTVECVVRWQDGFLRRRSLDFVGQWSDWEELGLQTPDAPALTVRKPGEVRCLIRGPDAHLWERVIGLGSTAGWADLGGSLADGPGVVERLADALPNPLPGDPKFGLPRDMWVVALDSQHVLQSRRWNGSGWDDWQPFAGGTSARRPLPLDFPWTPGAADVDQAALGSEAGWLGRASDEAGGFTLRMFWWQEFRTSTLSFIGLDDSGWVPVPYQPTSDPVAVNDLPDLPEAQDFNRASMLLFALPLDDPGGTSPSLLVTAAGPLWPSLELDWSPFSGASGNPAVVSVWERYEDIVNLHLLVRGDDGQLRDRVRSQVPAPVGRIRPQPTPVRIKPFPS
jgi:hypothetical protein